MWKFQRIESYVSLFLVALLLTWPAVSSADRKADEKTPEAEVKREVREAYEAIKSYTADQRDEAVGKIKATMQKIDDRIESLQSRIEEKWDRMDQAARRQAGSTLAALRKQRNEVAEWYGGVKYSSTEAWNHVKNGFLESYRELSQAFSKAENEFEPNGPSADSE